MLSPATLNSYTNLPFSHREEDEVRSGDLSERRDSHAPKN